MSKEKLLQFADLLDEYSDEIKTKRKDKNQYETKEEYAAQIMFKRHIETIKEIRSIIYYEL
jgi:hypothetical protein